jgi:hypothetical protein
MFKKFNDWLIAKEDSPFGRTRRAAAFKLGPAIPEAGINSRSTAPPGLQKRLLKKKKRKKKEK